MPVKDMATSTATLGLLRQLGSTVGVSIGQAIWSSVRSTNYNVLDYRVADISPQELRKKLAEVPGAMIDTSSANLADSIRQINLIEVRHHHSPSHPVADAFVLAAISEAPSSARIYEEYIHDLDRRHASDRRVYDSR